MRIFDPKEIEQKKNRGNVVYRQGHQRQHYTSAEPLKQLLFCWLVFRILYGVCFIYEFLTCSRYENEMAWKGRERERGEGGEKSYILLHRATTLFREILF